MRACFAAGGGAISTLLVSCQHSQLSSCTSSSSTSHQLRGLECRLDALEMKVDPVVVVGGGWLGVGGGRMWGGLDWVKYRLSGG